MINSRYDISEQRTDIHITPNDLLEVGNDFLRGINFASFRRPLTYYWWDEPKKSEQLKAKEQALLAIQQKQLEELQAIERERLK